MGPACPARRFLSHSVNLSLFRSSPRRRRRSGAPPASGIAGKRLTLELTEARSSTMRARRDGADRAQDVRADREDYFAPLHLARTRCRRSDRPAHDRPELRRRMLANVDSAAIVRARLRGARSSWRRRGGHLFGGPCRMLTELAVPTSRSIISPRSPLADLLRLRAERNADRRAAAPSAYLLLAAEIPSASNPARYACIVAATTVPCRPHRRSLASADRSAASAILDMRSARRLW